MPAYCFRCSGCDLPIELPQPGPGADGPLLRHYVGDEVCGVLRRDYRAEGANVNRQNLRNP